MRLEHLTKKEVGEISERNLYLLDKNWKEYDKHNHKNIAYLDARNIPPEFLAYHVAIKDQNLLTASTYIEGSDLSLGHVFFSREKKDVEHYLRKPIREFIKKEDDEMIYFSDVRNVKKGRIQTNYSSSAVFQDDILNAVSRFKRGIYEEQVVVETFRSWLKDFTIPLDKRKKSHLINQDYLLLKAPIKVLKRQE